MSPRLAFLGLILLSQTGCVAALPMIAQLATDPHSTDRLCSIAKMPGQTGSFCDRMHFTAEPQPAVKSPSVTTAAR